MNFDKKYPNPPKSPPLNNARRDSGFEGTNEPDDYQVLDLPKYWILVKSKTVDPGTYFYFNVKTGQRQWHFPEEEYIFDEKLPELDENDLDEINFNEILHKGIQETLEKYYEELIEVDKFEEKAREKKQEKQEEALRRYYMDEQPYIKEQKRIESKNRLIELERRSRETPREKYEREKQEQYERDQKNKAAEERANELNKYVQPLTEEQKRALSLGTLRKLRKEQEEYLPEAFYKRQKEKLKQKLEQELKQKLEREQEIKQELEEELERKRQILYFQEELEKYQIELSEINSEIKKLDMMGQQIPESTSRAQERIRIIEKLTEFRNKLQNEMINYKKHLAKLKNQQEEYEEEKDRRERLVYRMMRDMQNRKEREEIKRQERKQRKKEKKERKRQEREEEKE